MTDLTDKIATDASKPQSMSGDGISVTNRNLQDQIAADQYLRSVRGTCPSNVQDTLKGMILGIVPPGAAR